jgi:hypothetical protein
VKPLVSVLMPVRDGGRFLAAALGCVLDQLLRPIEVVVVDDGSRDGSGEWLERVADPRVRVFRTDGIGLVPALDLAAEKARAPYLARMDADDLCAPVRIGAQLVFLERRRDHVLVGSDFAVIDETDRALYPVRVPREDEEVRRKLETGNRFQHGAVLFRRSAFEEAGGYRAAMLHVEDYDLWTRLAERGRVANLDRILYFWRFRGGGVSLSNYIAQEAAAEFVRRCVRARRDEGAEPPSPTAFSAPPARRLRARARLARWSARCARLGGRPLEAARGYLRAALLCPWDRLLYEDLVLDVLAGRDRRARRAIPEVPRPSPVRLRSADPSAPGWEAVRAARTAVSPG